MMQRLNSPFLFVIPMLAVAALLWFQLTLIRNSYSIQQQNLELVVRVELDAISEILAADYYCYTTFNEQVIPANESFYLLLPGSGNSQLDTLRTQPDNSSDLSYDKFKFATPAGVRIGLDFEYMIDGNAELTSATNAEERWAISHYRNFLRDADQKRLVDTLKLDSLIQARIGSLQPDGQLAYTITSVQTGVVLFGKPGTTAGKSAAGITHPLYRSSVLPQIDLNVFLERQHWLRGTEPGLIAGAFGLVALLLLLFVMAFRMLLKQRKLNALKTDFIHVMTHEFNTPVTNIKLALANYEVGASEDRKQELLGIIGAESDRIGNSVASLLKATQLEHDSFVLNNTSLDLHTILDSVIAVFEPQLEEKQHVLHRDFQATNSRIKGEEAHLLNAIANLIDNAIKYAASGTPIVVSTRNTSKAIVLSIRDQGQGISRAEQALIFDKFYRINSNNNAGGFGLGLYYVKKILEKHGGRIAVESAPGEGAIFTIHLPQSQ